MGSPVISHIVTVYNKERYLPDTVASLLGQEGGLEREFIFVDDVSTDRSLAVIEECSRGAPNVTIVRNSSNQGPSVRLNQGARLARGQFLHFLDSDDMVPVNAIATMHRVLQETGADFLYGKWRHTNTPGAQLRTERIPKPDDLNVTLSEDPLGAILSGRNRRMCLLTTKTLFEKAGGADERIFIQDESLPLRLSVHARRFARIGAVVNLIPQTEMNLSNNRSQLNHDRFFAYRNALLDYVSLPRDKQCEIYRKCLSAMWKEYLSAHGARAYFSGIFVKYNMGGIIPPAPDMEYLERMTRFFLGRPNIRRP